MVLGTLINHPELLNRETLYELRSIVARYPYFQAARLMMLNNLYLLHDQDFGAELRRSVLYITDRRVLCRLIDGYTDRVATEDFEATEVPTVDRTLSLIDAFLETLPVESSGTLPVSDTMGDYASRFLMVEDSMAPLESTESSNDGSVDRALELIAHKESSKATPLSNTLEAEAIVDDESLDESYFTETLAKIYIKQHKYSRALEIIRSLYLQFPEKNAYFADQIRFLEKLIINNNLK